MNEIQTYSAVAAVLIVFGQVICVALRLHGNGDVWLCGISFALAAGYAIFLFREIGGKRRTGVISTAISGLAITVLYALVKMYL